MKNIYHLFILLLLICILPLTTAASDELLNDYNWSEIVEMAEGSKVSFYMWGGDRRINQWVDTFVAAELKELYDIELNRVPMGPDDYLNKLLGEKQLNRKKGSIDLLWINGENFKTAKENGLLFGPFADKLPNFNNYMDPDSAETIYDFGYPTDGYEVPYGKAQFVFIYDKTSTTAAPANMKELEEWIKENPGKFTYPALPDFTGSAFVRHFIYNAVDDYEQLFEMDHETFKKAIRPAMEKLKELKPYLWREGKTYPASLAQLDNMFADGEVWMSMCYHPTKASGEIQKGNFPETTRTFVLEEGTIANTHFLAIPFNSPNKAGAMVLANFLEGFDAQYSKLQPENWGDLPAFSMEKLTEEEKTMVEKTDLGIATLPQEKLQENRLPELPARFIPIIEEEWEKIVIE